MATEYKLSYTASEIDQKLGKVDTLETEVSALSEDIANQSGNSTVNPVPFKVQEIGQLFDQPLPYTAWCSGSLHYDASLGKYVDLLYCAPQHESPEYTASYVTHIDPKTYEASDPVLCKFYDTDGTTELSITYAGKPAFVILQDGTYMMLQSIGGTTYRFISVDYGLTWAKGGACSGYTISTETYALVQLSNGRILANAITREINYSDDGGITWTSVTPATSGASYEAEYCFLEVKPSVVLGICRKTVSGVGNSVSAASGDCEHAVYTISEDYGTTWSVLKESETIDNMNASNCTGYVHDGVVEIFAASRWYHDGDYATTDYTNTGKSGAITHYMATVENALNDKFTNMGVIVYAKTTGDTSPLAAQDFHTPCIAVNGTDMLMVYFDRVEPYNVADTVNHHYIRGSLNGIDYGVRDNLKSTIFPVSSAKVDALIRKAKNEMIIKINEAILSGGLIPPTDGDDPGTFVFDGIVANFNFADESAMNAEAMTVTDTINGIVATCTSETFPTVRENSVSGGTFSIPALSDYFDSTTLFAFTVEISVYREDGDSWSKYDFWSAYSNGGARNRFSATVANLHAINTSGSAVTYAQWATINPEATGHNHVVGTFSEDGTFCIYRNGELQATYNSFADFAHWPETVLTKASWVGEKLKAFRIYKRALTAEEVAVNYAYEKATIV